jgi:plasmid maintenance system antidote protein VapI
MAQAQELELMPEILLTQTKDANHAAKFMVGVSGVTNDAIGEEIGKPRETVTRFANGNGGLNANELLRLINACGNVFLLQYLASQCGFDLVRRDAKAQRKAELLAELEAIDMAA